jgi:MraZ protein
VEVQPDRQGRFIIPKYLKDFANIKRETMIIGVANRIEIWDREIWQQFYANSSQTFEKTAENIINP